MGKNCFRGDEMPLEYTSKVVLDINSNSAYTTVNAKSSDQNSRAIDIYIQEDGFEYSFNQNSILQFRLRKPDGTSVILTENADTYEDENHQTHYLLTRFDPNIRDNDDTTHAGVHLIFSGQCLAAAGRGYADIVETLNSDNTPENQQILSTVSFILNIMSSPNLSGLISENEYAVIIKYVAEAKEYADISVASASIAVNNANIAINSANIAKDSAASASASAALAIAAAISASQASASVEMAIIAANNASLSASSAANSAAYAASSAASASNYAIQASTSANIAYTSASQAIAAASSAAISASYVVHPPYIGDNKHWWIWNGTNYEDSGILAESKLINTNDNTEVTLWIGTFEEYNALQTIDSRTSYVIKERSVP